ncbi:MAG: ABC transporter ATP-binding protein [Firmicutes bacterium]|jgi:ATP-binding cassette subfamily B multidrug efflux pump|nr:ABC transporter ATP-binding protein [Bacillota bacterium]
MIKKLLTYVKEYKKTALITPVLVLTEVVLEILIPLIMAELIDKGIDNGSMPDIIKYGIALLISALMALVFGVAAGRTASVASSGFARNLRGAMYDHVQEFSFANIDKFSTASIVTRLTTDVSNVQIAFQMCTRIAMRAPGMLIFALIAAFRIDAQLSMVYIGILPILGIGLFILIKIVYPIFNRVFKTYDKLNNVVQENLYGMRVVKSFNRQDHEIEKFKKTSGEIYVDFSKAEKTMAFNMPLMQFCMYASMLLISWFGARAIVASGNDAALGLSTGELISLITYAMQILVSLMMISMIFVMFTMARASGERIVEILNEESSLHDPENPVFEVADGSIDFENVHFRYGKTKNKDVLDDINLHIKSGQTIGIIGATGSAKSSLVQLIPRLYDVTEGSVKVGGIDVRDYHIESLRNQVAVVLQKNTLFSGTIAENLRWGNENATDDELKHACKLACADEFIESFENGYDTYIEQGGSNVSGGQKQRLCIARALLKKPKILILDDSTSAVDTKTDAVIRQAFRSEIPDTTKIIIAQRIASVQDADQIIVLDDGHLADVGSHEGLMKNSDIYREVYESQNKGGGLGEQ